MNPIDIENACDLIRQIIQEGNFLCKCFPKPLKGIRLTDNDVYEEIYRRVEYFYRLCKESESNLREIDSKLDSKFLHDQINTYLYEIDNLSDLRGCLLKTCEQYCISGSLGNLPNALGFDYCEELFHAKWSDIEPVCRKVIFYLTEFLSTKYPKTFSIIV